MTRPFLAAALALNAAFAFGQAPDTKIPDAFGDRALVVALHTMLENTTGAEPWTNSEVKYTIPGTAVSAKLVGTNIVILISLTPYLSPTEGLVIVTQQQVWIRNAEGAIRYQTTLNTVNVKYGESVTFYPLGMEAKGRAPIRVEVVISRYQPGQAPQAGAGAAADMHASPEAGAPPAKP
ncbi:MAG: hypothetical protein NT080_02505 [Spirochaetes bacterium]|nr:hypothetical protein [Spirochaetota bacterium]